jgi:hypothetical protein
MCWENLVAEIIRHGGRFRPYYGAQRLRIPLLPTCEPNNWNDMDFFFSSYLVRKRTPDDAGTFLYLPIIKFTASRSELPSSRVYYTTVLWQLTIIPSLCVLIFYPTTTDAYIRSYPMISCFFSLNAHTAQSTGVFVIRPGQGGRQLAYVGRHVKRRVLLSHLDHNGLYRHVSVKHPDMKFLENTSGGRSRVPWGPIYVMKVKVAFRVCFAYTFNMHL